MSGCGSNTAAYQTIGGGSIAGQAVITAGYPSQGGGARRSKRRSAKRSVRRSTRRSAKRSTRRSAKRSTRRSAKRSARRSMRRSAKRSKNFVYLEYKKGTSNKYWSAEITKKKDRIFISYGKIGPYVQKSMTKKLGRSSPKKVKEIFNELIDSKIKKGYKITKPPLSFLKN